MTDATLKKMHEDILGIIEEKSRVLDLGCGEGDLLKALWDRKQVYGLGIDFSTDAVLKCIKKGVSVIQEDVDEGLSQYKDSSYDYVILSETLQAVKKPDFVLRQIARVGKKAVVSFPNFAFYRNRLQVFFGGVMPKSETLPYEWYDTPNIHLLTINDFRIFCRASGIRILREIFYTDGKKIQGGVFSPNWFAEEALFLIQKG